MSNHHMKILLVDDDPSILESLAGLMAVFGYESVTAKNGFEAIKKLDNDFFDIVLSDMAMQDMDGMALLKYIHTNYPNIKVMITIGCDRSFSYTDVIRAGASDFISKPFNTDELQAKLNRLVSEINLMHQLELLSISDGLTGLYNRRYFDTKILEETQRAHRQNHDLFLAVLDVDNLKEINDKYGHPAGDKLLQSVAVTLKQCIRENVDWPFRYGGDEFCVILTQVSQDQALMTTQRFIQHFDENKMPLTGLSIGLARFIRRNENRWSEDIADLVRRADIAMYKAKENGRNRVVIDQGNGKIEAE
jgi:two-component system cell cycle response regulator